MFMSIHPPTQSLSLSIVRVMHGESGTFQARVSSDLGLDIDLSIFIDSVGIETIRR